MGRLAHMDGGGMIAYICAWCDEPLDDRSAQILDEDDRTVSHGICRDCARKHGFPLDEGDE